MIAYETCKLVYLLTKRVLFQIIEINKQSYAVQCRDIDTEIDENTDITKSLSEICVVEDELVERLEESWVIVEQKRQIIEKEFEDDIELSRSYIVEEESKEPEINKNNEE